MIELKNVSRTYKSKKAKTKTVALQDVSIKFQEKGLVFILGKSGCGKSTLLNIIGGLDKCDSGEVIINGKSTNEFKEKDFDAFRNTYMGFIFQEYNLLDNYSIEQNIKLSLELQHQKVTDEQVKNVLEQVELEDISKRKTNELSGGQKQRVAIARALIKEPEVILADEPTGNLDSQTSEQIWKILKRLSETKLIIVVTHDIETAEKYGDRIIKLQDGKVVADSNQDEIINKKEFKLQSAKLPFFYSFKMGVANLFHKKFRLIFSSLLIIFSLICFGIMLAASSSDINSTILRMFEENGPTTVSIEKYKNKMEYIKMSKEMTFGDEEYDLMKTEEAYATVEITDKLKQDITNNTGVVWEEVYKVDTKNGAPQMVYSVNQEITDYNAENYLVYYYEGIGALPVITKYNGGNIKNLIGRAPNKKDEIVISSYLADMIMYHGCIAKNEKQDNIVDVDYKPKSYLELVNSNKYINFCDIDYVKVVGIIDYSEHFKKYEILKTKKMGECWNVYNEEIDKLYWGLMNDAVYKGSKVYVHEQFIKDINAKEKNYQVQMLPVISENENVGEIYSDTIAYINEPIKVCTPEGIKTITKLEKDEIIINTSMMANLTTSMYDYYAVQDYIAEETDYVIKYLQKNNIVGTKIKTPVKDGKIINNKQDYAEYKIVGVAVDENAYYGIVYYSKENIEKLITKNAYVNKLVATIDDKETMEKVLEYCPADNSHLISSSEYSSTALESILLSEMIQFVAKYGVVFFLVFSAIILMNFIHSSIRFRKKEIGILRALGCRSKDIIKMFVYESLILMLITLLVATLVIPPILQGANSFISSQLFVKARVFNFSIELVLQMFVIMLAIVVLANIIPVRRITKMKPIDAILNK